MKKLLAVVLAGLMVMGFAGCSPVMSQDEYDSAPLQEEQSAMNEEETNGNQDDNIVASAIFDIGDNGSMSITVNQDGDKIVGSSVLTSPGKNIGEEMAWFIAAMTWFESVGINDYTLAGSVGGNIFGYVFVDGEASSSALPLPEEYLSEDIPEEYGMDALAKITEMMKEELN